MDSELKKQALQVANDLVHAKILKKLYHITDNQKSIQTRILHNLVCEIHDELKKIALFIHKISDINPNQPFSQNNQEEHNRDRASLVAQVQDLKYQEQLYEEQISDLEEQVQELKDTIDEIKYDYASLQREHDELESQTFAEKK